MDDQPTNPSPVQPQQPVEQAAWVPTTPGVTQPPVPPPVPKKGMPLVLKIMIGCGALVFLGIPVVLVLIVISAINPAARISEESSRANGSDIREASVAINVCITVENNKNSTSTASSSVYSTQTCANPQYLKSQNYTTKELKSGIVYQVNPSRTKICAYLGSGANLASWDSSVGTVLQNGSGKTTCL